MKVRRSEQGKRRRGFKPDAAAGSTRKPEHDHIRLRGVGFHQYRKLAGLPQAGPPLEMLTASPSERLHDHENHDTYHQNSRYLIDNTIKFLTFDVTVGGKCFYPTNEEAVNGGHHQHQQ